MLPAKAVIRLPQVSPSSPENWNRRASDGSRSPDSLCCHWIRTVPGSYELRSSTTPLLRAKYLCQ
ncbi:MAG TPA: hypothetical protein G4O10_02300 [Dehalococcoidia bacterium]|nr:hypothetical protein [Dehalococcoidia bacterium]